MTGVPDGRLPAEPARVIATLDARAFGIAIGVVVGAGVFLATIVLLVKGGDVVGPNLALLSQYFLGYRVSALGAFVGAAYGFLTGFLAGFAFAGLRNLLIMSGLRYAWRRAERRTLRDLLDHMS